MPGSGCRLEGEWVEDPGLLRCRLRFPLSLDESLELLGREDCECRSDTERWAGGRRG